MRGLYRNSGIVSLAADGTLAYRGAVQPGRTLGRCGVPKRIFIVDDSRVVRRFLRTHLENNSENLVCAEAEDGLDAVRRVAEVAPDVIILDLSMPRMGGLEAAEILHGVLPNVPIILYTLHAEIVNETLAKNSGVRAVVSKTDPFDVLLGEIRSCSEIGRSRSA